MMTKFLPDWKDYLATILNRKHCSITLLEAQIVGAAIEEKSVPP